MLTTHQDGEKRFHPGVTVEVFGPAGQMLFLGKIEESDGKTIQIVAENDSMLPPVIYNTRIKVVEVSAKEEIAVLFGMVCGSTAHMWKLDRLNYVIGQEKRYSYRQRVRVDALVQSKEDGTCAVPCQILDVSMGGARISCAKPFQVEDRLLLTKAQIDPDAEPFAFDCRVRRVGEGGSYGCEFQHVSPKEEERLFRAILVAQRKEIRKQRTR